MKRALTAAAGCVFTAVLLAGAPTARAEGPGVERLAEGKKRFEDVCSKCHEIDRPLSKDMSRAEWDTLLLTMAGKGAQFTPEEQGVIVDYLVARSIFASRCVVCHTKERIVDSSKTLAEWKTTVEKMAAIEPGAITGGEADFIVDYLTLTLGKGAE